MPAADMSESVRENKNEAIGTVDRGDLHVSLLATRLADWCLIIALLLRKAGSRRVQNYRTYIMYFIIRSFIPPTGGGGFSRSTVVLTCCCVG